MKYDKVTVFGIIACVVFFFLWLQLSSRLAPPPPPRPAPSSTPPAAAPGEAGQESAGAEQPAAETPEAAEQSAAPEELPQPQGDTPAGGPPISSEGAARVAAADAPFTLGQDSQSLVQEDTYSAVADTGGGGIRNVSLLEYFEDEEGAAGESSRSPVRLGHYDFPLLALRPPSSSWRLGPARIVERSSRRLVLERSVNDGRLILTETWTVEEAAYEIGYTLSVRNTTDGPVTIPALVIDGGALPPSTSPDRRVSSRGGVGAGGATVAVPGGGRPKTYSMKAIGKMDSEERARMSKTPVSWVAVHSKYFLFCVLPAEGTVSGCSLAVRPPVESASANDGEDTADGYERYQASLLLGAATIPAGSTHDVSLRAYAGPKKYDLLHAMGNRVETVMEMDRFLMFNPAWMGLLSRGILSALTWLNGVFGGKWGYGLAIILLTVAVKLVFWPLSHRSTQSMRKMQKLQPQLKELREKYKDEPQKMYRKQQELFKENNVSQFGSCLPMLFQIPVFFALFNTFRNAIELRQAGFLWASDLSLPDTLAFSPAGIPIRPFAVLMGLTMIGQQKLMPSGDPNQARMMTFMSLFFIVLFYSMPSALTLYMTVNQVLTVVQTLVTKQLEKEGD
jgi:YidC/Oxa1 family membrane protein insertase